jgi:hypothetical protein
MSDDLLMTGFDSEAGRRDALRKQIVDAGVAAVLNVISQNAVTYTPAERMYLQIAIAQAVLNGVRLEAMSALFCEEIATATEQIDG